MLPLSTNLEPGNEDIDTDRCCMCFALWQDDVTEGDRFFVCVADGSMRIVLKMLSKTKMETNVFAHIMVEHWLLYCE